ncbi:MAG TPA: bacterial transcriptional activator domain-containing protein [Mycobacterium sp.]|nr:bacterial transcriptional activator domain-containing protein [Mycobacterium sp.]
MITSDQRSTNHFGWLRTGDLLPGWYDDWVVIEQERLRQLKLHGLEASARRLAADGRYGEALELAFEAVRLEPLRESAHRAVIDALLAEGNVSDALGHYRRFCAQLAAELGVAPSARLVAVMRRAVPALADVQAS